MKMEELKSIVVIPEEGLLLINGKWRKNISALCLKFINEKWELYVDEENRYEAIGHKLMGPKYLKD